MTALRPPATDAALILGGGLMGLAIAHQLARRDHPVCVISRRRGEAAGFVAAGMLAPHAEGLSGDQLRFGQLSLERVPSWVAQIEADSGLPCGLRSTGIVVPFSTSDQRDRYPSAPFGTALNRQQLEREVPGIATTWQAGLLFECLADPTPTLYLEQVRAPLTGEVDLEPLRAARSTLDDVVRRLGELGGDARARAHEVDLLTTIIRIGFGGDALGKCLGQLADTLVVHQHQRLG